MADATSQSEAVAAWGLGETEPTNLLALTAGAGPPVPEAVQTHITGTLAAADLTVRPLPPDDVHWALAIEGGPGSMPIVVWCEPNRGGLPDIPGTADSAWMVGVETLLPPDEPLEGYATLVHLLRDVVPDTPALLDVNCASWLPASALDEQFGRADIAPPPDALWVIQSVRSRDGATFWHHTHGLWRSGRIELEMLGVPAAHAETAAALLDEIATLLLDVPIGPPGSTLEIGPDLHVALVPWPDAAAALPADAPGAPPSREDGSGVHQGPRAAVCAAEPDPDGVWRWPAGVIAQIESGQTAVYRTSRVAHRQAALARDTWPHLARAVTADGAEIVVRAGFDAGDAEGTREHLWFRLVGLEGDAATGELVTAPRTVTHLTPGDVRSLLRTDVSDWFVELPGRGGFGPDDTPALLDALDDG